MNSTYPSLRLAGADERCGEASAAYLYSEDAAERIRKFDPGARIIMIFREPASFLHSYHLQLLKNSPSEGESVRDLRTAMRLEPARREGRRLPNGCLVPELLYYSERIRYEEHLDRFAALFPAEQILPLVYDDFRADNRATVRRVFEFLSVDPDFEPRLEDHNTGGLALRSRRTESLLRRAQKSAVASTPAGSPRRATSGGGPGVCTARLHPGAVSRRGPRPGDTRNGASQCGGARRAPGA